MAYVSYQTDVPTGTFSTYYFLTFSYMAWVAYQGNFKLAWGPKAASQVLTAGALVDQTSGYITVCSSTTTKHAGITMRTVVAGDTDYTLTTRIPVQVPCDAAAKFKVSVYASDTLLQSDIGMYADQAGSPVGIDVTRASSSYDCFLIADYLGANSCAGYLNSFQGFRTS
jgi:hypothetical protein